jgi:hypothetical protein
MTAANITEMEYQNTESISLIAKTLASATQSSKTKEIGTAKLLPIHIQNQAFVLNIRRILFK